MIDFCKSATGNEGKIMNAKGAVKHCNANGCPISYSWFNKLSRRGDGPPYRQLWSAGVVYTEADLDRWIATRNASAETPTVEEAYATVHRLINETDGCAHKATAIA